MLQPYPYSQCAMPIAPSRTEAPLMPGKCSTDGGHYKGARLPNAACQRCRLIWEGAYSWCCRRYWRRPHLRHYSFHPVSARRVWLPFPARTVARSPLGASRRDHCKLARRYAKNGTGHRNSASQLAQPFADAFARVPPPRPALVVCRCEPLRKSQREARTELRQLQFVMILPIARSSDM